MPAPLISCIVAVYDGEAYLAEALDSILAQTQGPIEVVVVDDGSTDGTSAVAARLGALVRLVRQVNAGPAAARNRGLAEARGEMVAFLDADDVWHPEKLARQSARFRERPELELCVTHVQNFWAPELQAEEERMRGRRPALPAPGYLTQTLLARRSLFDRIGRFDESWRHAHDTEWFLRARERGAVSELLPDVLVRRRLHPRNRSRLLHAASRDEYLRLLKRRLDSRSERAAGAADP